MKSKIRIFLENGIRIFFVCAVLLGGTALFGYWSMYRFDKSMDVLMEACYSIARQPPILASRVPNTQPIAVVPEPVPEPEPEPVEVAPEIDAVPEEEPAPEVVPVAVTPKDLTLAFAFPKKDNTLYNGCTYPVTFVASGFIGVLKTDLVDAGAKSVIDPAKSRLAKENAIPANATSLNWGVSTVWPGTYYLKVTDANGVVLRSGVFAVKNMPANATAAAKEKLCTDTGAVTLKEG